MTCCFGIVHQDIFEFVPRRQHLFEIRHVRHAAPGLQVRQDHDLIGASEDGGAFRHEMHARKDDIFRFDFRAFFAQLVAVALKIGKLHHFIALVMMSQDHHFIAQDCPRAFDPLNRRLLPARSASRRAARSFLLLLPLLTSIVHARDTTIVMSPCKT